VDNFCHTLVGAAFGEAGLKRRTRFGNPTLMIAANLPDIDVLSFVTDTNPISFRRGWDARHHRAACAAGAVCRSDVRHRPCAFPPPR
jgi:hypothetical protein